MEKLLCARWTVSILRLLRRREYRYTQMRHDLPGISPTLLSSRLRNLQRLGVIEVARLAPPADCDVYRLAPLGVAAAGFLQAMDDWFLLAAGKGAGAALSGKPFDDEREGAPANAIRRKAKRVS